MAEAEKTFYEQRIPVDAFFVIKTTSPGWVQRQQQGDVSADAELDIWQEPADHEKNLQFEAGPNGKPTEKILCGTLNKLVERLTDDKTHGKDLLFILLFLLFYIYIFLSLFIYIYFCLLFPDLAYVKTFLLTYRSFTTPEILLKKIIERYHVPRPVNAAFDDFERNIKRPIQLRACNVLKQWMEKHYTDFLDGDVLAPWVKQVVHFIRDIIASDDKNLAKQLLNTVEKLVRPSFNFLLLLLDSHPLSFT